MSKKISPVSSPKIPLELVVSRDDAKTRLQNRIEKGLEIHNRPINRNIELEEKEQEFVKWHEFNRELLKRIFSNSEMSDEYLTWSSGSIIIYDRSIGEEIADLHDRIKQKLHKLDSIIERLELIPLQDSGSNLTVPSASTLPARSNKVFVVHGRDELAKTNLEIFLRENNLIPVVLHREANEGLTIIEKFEKHSDVGYAFILLTPDEIAYLSSEEDVSEEKRKKESRARPNVIFEFGYFVGKLGRPRVCCLHKGDVVLPSDLGGVIYKKFSGDIESVGYSILKDLQAAGYDVLGK